MDLENSKNGQFKHPFPVKFVGCLSNFEVYEYFKEIKDDSAKNDERNKALKSNTHLSTIVYEASQYFNQTRCVEQTKEGIRSFIHRVQPYNLTKPEKLTMINTLPTSPVDIQAIVEESEERLTEQQESELLKIIEESFPSISNNEEEGSHSDDG